MIESDEYKMRASAVRSATDRQSPAGGRRRDNALRTMNRYECGLHLGLKAYGEEQFSGERGGWNARVKLPTTSHLALTGCDQRVRTGPSVVLKTAEMVVRAQPLLPRVAPRVEESGQSRWGSAA